MLLFVQPPIVDLFFITLVLFILWGVLYCFQHALSKKYRYIDTFDELTAHTQMCQSLPVTLHLQKCCYFLYVQCHKCQNVLQNLAVKDPACRI